MTENTEKTENYEEMMNELKEIARKLDDAETTVEEAVILHARGMELIKKCEEFLDKAELTINEVHHSAEQSE